MNKRIGYRLVSILLILSLLFIAGCGGGETTSTPDSGDNSVVSTVTDATDAPNASDDETAAGDGESSDTDDTDADVTTTAADDAGDATTAAAGNQTTAQNATTDKPAVNQPTTNKPAADKTVVNKPTTNKPVADKTVVNKPTTNKPVADKTVVNKPTANKTTANQTAVNKPTANKTTANKTTAKDTAIDYTEGSKPAKRATKINGFVRRAGKYLIDEAGDEWFVKGGGIDNGSLAGKFESNDTYCNESLYKEHAALGCNTIRLTFNWEIFVKSRNSSQFRETGFEWLAQNVKWAKKYNLRLILNMHRIPCGDGATGNMHQPAIFWNKTYQQQWKAVWREIARRFANEPVILAYSMWNEQNAPYQDAGSDVAKKVYGDLYQECIDVIRTVDKKHMIVCEQVYNVEDKNGSVMAISYPAFPALKEKNLMYEYHNYYPYDFTYQNINGDGKMVVYGTTANYNTIWAQHNIFARYRDEMNVPVFCGEWGAYHAAYRDGTKAEKWAEDMMKVLKDLNMQFTLHTPFAMYSKKIQPWHYANGTPSWGGAEHSTILEDAFKKYMPTM